MQKGRKYNTFARNSLPPAAVLLSRRSAVIIFVRCAHRRSRRGFSVSIFGSCSHRRSRRGPTVSVSGFCTHGRLRWRTPSRYVYVFRQSGVKPACTRNAYRRDPFVARARNRPMAPNRSPSERPLGHIALPPPWRNTKLSLPVLRRDCPLPPPLLRPFPVPLPRPIPKPPKSSSTRKMSPSERKMSGSRFFAFSQGFLYICLRLDFILNIVF